MDHKNNQEIKPKVSRSAARHLRRKKLVAARREAENNSFIISTDDKTKSIVTNQGNHENIVPKHHENSRFIIDCNNISNKNVACNVDAKNNLKSQSVIAKNNLDFSKSTKNIDSTDFISKVDSNILNKSSKTLRVANCDQNNSGNIADIVESDKRIATDQSFSKLKMDSQEKTREQIKAEREAKKLAKLAAKTKGKVQGLQNDSVLNNLTPNNTQEAVNKSEKSKPIGSKTEERHKTEEDKEKVPEKSKAELKAERRAKQEAQRAAKQATKDDKQPTKPTEKSQEKSVVQEKSKKVTNKEESVKKIVIIKAEMKDNLHEVNLFKHLYINKKTISQITNLGTNVNIHPAILRLGVQYAEKVVVGSNARCVALLAAVKQLIEDFERPSQADFTRGLETSLQESVHYLNSCRPSAVSMQNALKHLKWQMSNLSSTISDKQAKSILTNAIDTYIKEQIQLASDGISMKIQEKISNDDVILTYGFSSLIFKILDEAHTKKKFRVIVVDGRPFLEGKELLRRLVKKGIDCSYILINSLSYVMPQVTKVFLGAHAILANGAVMSRVGTAQVALIANAFNVPVLVACETHKSCERVQTDSIVYNEIGNPDDLVKSTFSDSKKSCLSNWKIKKSLNLLNITYDVTPADLVTAVVTELAILPCTSVPVILRIKPSEM